jgi:hypothetical protein
VHISKTILFHLYGDVCEYLSIHDQENWLSAGVKGQEGMFNPPRHLVTNLVRQGRRVYLFVFRTFNRSPCFATDHYLVNG